MKQSFNNHRRVPKSKILKIVKKYLQCFAVSETQFKIVWYSFDVGGTRRGDAYNFMYMSFGTVSKCNLPFDAIFYCKISDVT